VVTGGPGVRGWRHEHEHALLIVDQFEELFTQNGPEEQRRCAEVLGRIALDGDVHVLLSMRDDFLMRCHDQEALAPIFSERRPEGAGRQTLRRAVVQPALKCGFRFEDEVLADLAEVEERGVPLLPCAGGLWGRTAGVITPGVPRHQWSAANPARGDGGAAGPSIVRGSSA
jgi:hypothetical protein